MVSATAGMFVSPRSPEILAELRKSFVDAAEKPTFAELAKRFDMPLRTVYSRASEERWHELRAARLQAAEVKGETLALISKAAERTDSKLIQGFSDLILLTLERITETVVELSDSDLKATTKLNGLSSATFAILNLTNSSKNIGLVSFDRNLEKLGKEDNGRWNPQLLQQINVTVEGLKAQASAEKPATPIPPAQEVD